MNAQVETYVMQAPVLSQRVINVWGAFLSQGNHCMLSEEFKILADKALRYEQAKRLADNHRDFGVLTVDEEKQEREARLAFARTCQELDVCVAV